MIIGYARVSTEEQNLEMQIEALHAFGCDKIFFEKVSGVLELEEKNLALRILSEGDTLVVWKLDRLARSVVTLLRDIEYIQNRGANFVSLKDSIDTSTIAGRFQFVVFAALSEFERGIISERTKAGLESARKRGRKGGRPRGFSKDILAKCRLVTDMVSEGEISIEKACLSVGVGRTTYYKVRGMHIEGYKP
ncbi:recombinase family protein [Porphyromonas gingivicanis]|uniref:recombinase family protein n=1 Tax=Porphyromonas gingivicanis TaxID=266762 RepID=UPI00046F9A01|nr:recombinase family protein [Porphyromonas gingivicanis]